MKRVLVIGFDGMEPSIVEPMLAAGELPHLARLTDQGGYSRVRTTCPAQTPVAWSTFATGTNPGGHGIYDFIRRDPRTYLPDLALNRYEQKNPYTPPKVVNLRRGTAVWELLSAAGIPSVVLRHPCTYPPDNIRGRMLAGVGVPDLRGGLGTSTLYTTAAGVAAGESENVVVIAPGARGHAATQVVGPRSPRQKSDFSAGITLTISPGCVAVRADGQTVEARQGEWSEWLRLKFKTGLLQSVKGVVRFHLVRTDPELELYASPVNFDPDAPLFPISSPAGYAGELAQRTGLYYTAGMAEDHTGFNNGRFDECAFLDQCQTVLRERERMLMYEMERFEEGLLFCLFDTPDRLAHMMWRFREPGHPANHGRSHRDLARTIEEHYRECDAIAGRAIARSGDDTLVVVLSDHGMNSFQRGVHLNTWLHQQGLLALRSGCRPGHDAGEFFRTVDWSRTKAYSLGLGAIYLNRKGREEQGTVDEPDAGILGVQIAEGLAALGDPETGKRPIRGVVARGQVYSGPYTAEAPDLLVNFESGYRVSWATALGGIPEGLFEDNTKRWGGDHIIDPCLVPGVLFMNRKFAGEAPALTDMAPTILSALGVDRGPAMEGKPLLL